MRQRTRLDWLRVAGDIFGAALVLFVITSAAIALIAPAVAHSFPALTIERCRFIGHNFFLASIVLFTFVRVRSGTP